MKTRFWLAAVALLAALASIYWIASSSGSAQAIILVNPGRTYQTFMSWEATAFVGETDLPELGFYGFNPSVLVLYGGMATGIPANELGINRLRLPIQSGTENTQDYFSPYINGQIPRSEFAAHRYETINDNNDPNVMNPGGFNFVQLDYKVDTVVLPLKQQLAVMGENLYINLNYTDFDPSTRLHRDNPDEYAEFILATFQHLENKYAWVPDGVEIILEPNNAFWTPTQVGNALVAAAQRLQAAGYNPDFIAPSHSSLNLGYFDQMIQAVPGTLTYLTEFSYHCYGGCNDANLLAVGSRGTQYGINTSQLEHIDHTYIDLHRDLGLANVSAWQQYNLAGPFGDATGGGKYYHVDVSDQNDPQVIMTARAHFLRQYMKFIRRGAVRIGATSNNGSFEPLAFINVNGGHVVVVKANTGGDLLINGLPADSYGIKYTTDQDCSGVNVLEYDVNLPDVTISAGTPVTTNIPACGVITIYSLRGTGIASGVNAVVVNGPATGAESIPYTFTATADPITATLPITYTWQATGQSPVSYSDGRSSTFLWSTTGTKAISVTAANAYGSASDSFSIVLGPAEHSYLPAIANKSGSTWQQNSPVQHECRGG